MHSGLSADEQHRQKQEALRELAFQLAPEPSDRSDEKNAGVPRFPHQGPPPTRDEWRSFLRRVGWNKTAAML